MEGNSFTPNYRPTVTIFSDPGGLALSITEKLLGNFCRVEIVTRKEEQWKEKTGHIAQKDFLVFKKVNENPEYIIFIDLTLEASQESYGDFINLYQKGNSKALVILPFGVAKENTKKREEVVQKLKDVDGGLGFVFLGDLVGPRISRFDGSSLAEAVVTSAPSRSFSFPRGDFYPLSVSDAAKEISRSLFSFGPYGTSLAIIGEEISGFEVFQKLKVFFPENEIAPQEKEEREVLIASERVVKPVRIDEAIKEMLSWKKEEPELQEKIEEKREKKERKVKISLPKPRRGVLYKLFLLFVALVILPYAFLVLSLSSLALSSQLLKGGNLKAVRASALVSEGTSGIAFAQLSFFSRLPLVGGVFLGSKNLSSFLARASRFIENSVKVAAKGSGLALKVLGDEVYDLTGEAGSIATDLDYLYKESGFLLTEVESYSGPFASVLKKNDLYRQAHGLRGKLLEGRKIVGELPLLLGREGLVSYLILFQNNMELRPTGGFIGSFAIASFDSGRLVDLTVSDVYSADGQLKGHVEPPSPIRDYLGEANWYLRDSNWDADFPTSASRAEWFLDKEMDKKVEGVIALDLELAKNILGVTGPVSLPDFNQVIDKNNLYEKTQAEVEENFFPGSYKKTNFLTALARQILERVSQAKEEEVLPLAKEFILSLEQKHIQVFLHNRVSQSAVTSLGFDGAVSEPVCSGNCYSDWFGVVDANVGVNKANYFLERSLAASVSFEGATLKRFLTATFKNSANPALGESGRYRSYLRVMLPARANLNDVEQTLGAVTERQTPEITEVRGRKEAGVLLEVAPGQTKEITFSWQEDIPLDFFREGEYRLYIRKQAGTVSDKLTLSIFTPELTGINLEPSYFLTGENSYGYNTLLTRDFFSRISWKDGQTNFDRSN